MIVGGKIDALEVVQISDESLDNRDIVDISKPVKKIDFDDKTMEMPLPVTQEMLNNDEENIKS